MRWIYDDDERYHIQLPVWNSVYLLNPIPE